MPSSQNLKRRAITEPEAESIKQEVEGVDEDGARIEVLEVISVPLRMTQILTNDQTELQALQKKKSQKKTNKKVKVEPKLPKGFVSGEVIDLA